MNEFDHIVVGHGLAGAALTLELRRRGRRVAVIDKGQPFTASTVAAGLMAPINGRRLTVTPDWDAFWSAAIAMYVAAEAETSAQFLHRGPVVRLFDSFDDAVRLQSRRPAADALISCPEPLVDAGCLRNEYGGFVIPDAGRLDVPRFLQATRGQLQAEGALVVTSLLVDELQLDDVRCVVPRLGLSAPRVTFTEGFEAASNPLFEQVRFDSVKGEILTVRIPGLAEPRVVQARGLWLCPLGEERWLAGATYTRDRLDCVPTAAGRTEIEDRLREFLLLPFEVLQHAAAVRPIITGRQPVLGQHPQRPAVSFLNGLGSRGALLAPGLASMLVDSLDGMGTVPDRYSLQRRLAIDDDATD